jgi:cytochrome c biogenesis protein CcmG/thiol:disulfide interchange protein DsbE
MEMTNRENRRRLRAAGRVLPTLVLSILMLTPLFHGCGGGAPDTGATKEPAGRRAAADFSLSDLQGTTHRLADYRGKVVVLNFWDTWCGPCRQEIPGFIALQEQFRVNGLQLLGVALAQEGAARVKDYASQAGINYPVLVLGDDKSILTDYGGINSIPATFIIDREGYIVDKHIGYLSRSAFESLIKPILSVGGEKS